MIHWINRKHYSVSETGHRNHCL